MANENELTLQNAKWFAAELGNFSGGTQAELIHLGHTGDFEGFNKVLLQNSRTDANRLWQGFADWKSLADEGEKIEIASPKTETSEPEENHSEHPEHFHQGPHYQEAHEENLPNDKKTDSPSEASEKKMSPEEAEQKLRQAAEAGKGKNITPESTIEYLENIRQKSSINQSSPLIIPASRTRGQSPYSDSQPIPEVRSGPTNTKASTPPSNPIPLRRRATAGINIPGKGIAKGAVKRGTKKLATSVAGWVAANPLLVLAGAITIGVFIGFIFIIAFIIHSCEHFWDDPIGNAPIALIGNITGICNVPDIPTAIVPTNPPGVTTEKNGPSHVANGGNIVYEITVRYDPAVATTPIDQLSVFDVALFENELVSATGSYTRGQGESGFNYVRWLLSQNQESPEDYEFNFTIVVKPTISDFIAINALYVAPAFRDVTVDYTASASARYRVQ